jgi:hypothetical protein
LTLIPRQDASGLGGKAVTFQAASASDTLVGGQCVHLLVNNGSGTTRQVTITTPETVEGSLAVADRVITGILTTAIWEIPIPSRYNDPITGLTTIVVDVPATVTVAAVQTTPTP